MSQSEESRIAVLETKVDIFTKWMGDVDSRLRSIERLIWIGTGVLVVADLAFRYFLK